MQAIVYPNAYHSFDAASGIEKPHSVMAICSHMARQQPPTLTRGYLNFYIGVCIESKNTNASLIDRPALDGVISAARRE